MDSELLLQLDFDPYHEDHVLVSTHNLLKQTIAFRKVKINSDRLVRLYKNPEKYIGSDSVFKYKNDKVTELT